MDIELKHNHNINFITLDPRFGDARTFMNILNGIVVYNWVITIFTETVVDQDQQQGSETSGAGAGWTGNCVLTWSVPGTAI